eukprot:62841-Amphidinium_carterae.1
MVLFGWVSLSSTADLWRPLWYADSHTWRSTTIHHLSVLRTVDLGKPSKANVHTFRCDGAQALLKPCTRT